jgi:hypothetical protein
MQRIRKARAEADFEEHVELCQHTSAYVSIRHIRQHTPAYVSIRQHTPAYISKRQHTSAYVSILAAATITTAATTATTAAAAKHERACLRVHVGRK